MRCLLSVSASDEAISLTEENDLQRIAKVRGIGQTSLVALRVAHKQHLPGRLRA